MRIKILSWLLHHANRHTKSEYFYAIKNRLLKKYGVHVRYDVQYIEGKKCNSCGGEGVHPKYGYDGKIYDYADCYHCHGGWYKLPTWNILALLQFGKYQFHQPYKRVYAKPLIEFPLIEGYIEHNDSKHGSFALTVLCLLYEKGYLKRWYNGAGSGWYVYWWLPRNWPHNIVHIIKNGKNAMPFRKRKTFTPIKYTQYMPTESDDLPF